jgi:two-component system, chemotaxis family, chemotaxis protein CheY
MSDELLVPKILIVDDTSFQRERLRIFFQKIGCEIVAEADNGQNGIDLFTLYVPDLVTMDVNMPYMGGIEAVREIIKKNPDARIIMVSAMGDPETIKEAISAGAKDFVIKPFSYNTMKKTVSKILSDFFPGFFD